MRRARAKVLGSIMCVAVLGGGCSDSGKSGSTTATTVKYDVKEGVESPAATLRADLTDLLQEHVLLVGIVTDAQLAGQDAGPATAVLDQNSADLGTAVAGFYGADTGAQFLDPWRRHTAGLVAFTSVAASTDKAPVAAAKAALTAIQGEIAKVLNTVNVQLTTEALTESFGGYATSLESAITARAKNDPEAASKLKKAADKMADVGIVLAAGIAKQKKDDVTGKIDAISAVMRTSLAAKLQQHTYLAGIATGTMLGGGDATSAAKALDENSLELSRAIGSVYGDEAARRFLQLWRQHIEFIVDYAEAAAAGDTTKKGAARSALDGYRSTFASFLNDANPKLAKTAVAEDLGAHVETLLATVDAQAAKDAGQVSKLRTAAMHMPGTALLLATGIARQFPTKFG
ncbi:MAG TPA: hypothetical protein VHM89_09595 [Acidimicrobiales bacterium]|nr:hypothetical protein [Acidimicrobiales bacterium]